MRNQKTTSNNAYTLRAKIWGARGSLPSPMAPAALEKHIGEAFRLFFQAGHSSEKDVPAFLRQLPRHCFGGYGGNTPCVEVTSSGSRVIVDAGSGIRPLGYELMAGPCGKGAGEVHIVFTHFHWDHLIGLPFFTPIFIPGNQIHLYAVQPELQDVLKTLFRKPFFPVPLERLGATIHYHSLAARAPQVIGDISVTPYLLDHPDPCWGHRFEKDGKAIAHCVDTECNRATRDQLGADLPLYQGVDLMLFDAQYTLMETIEKVDWGHAAASLGLDIALREGIRRVIFMHHDPASANEKIAAAEAQARRYYDSQVNSARRSGIPQRSVEWSFGHEGMTVEV